MSVCLRRHGVSWTVLPFWHGRGDLAAVSLAGSGRERLGGDLYPQANEDGADGAVERLAHAWAADPVAYPAGEPRHEGEPAERDDRVDAGVGQRVPGDQRVTRDELREYREEEQPDLGFSRSLTKPAVKPWPDR